MAAIIAAIDPSEVFPTLAYLWDYYGCGQGLADPGALANEVTELFVANVPGTNQTARMDTALEGALAAAVVDALAHGPSLADVVDSYTSRDEDSALSSVIDALGAEYDDEATVQAVLMGDVDGKLGTVMDLPDGRLGQVLEAACSVKAATGGRVTHVWVSSPVRDHLPGLTVRLP